MSYKKRRPKASDLERKVFSSYKGPQFSPPDFVRVQYDSFDWFLNEGVENLLQDVSPIKDHTGEKVELHFMNHEFDSPKYSEEQARERGQTYEAPLRADVKLVDKVEDEEITQEVYLGDFPMMTEKGTFIMNGVERVVVSQLKRSPGVYYNSRNYRGEKYFGAKLIPDQGSWLEFRTEKRGYLSCKIDRKKKAPVTQLLRVFGYESNEEIEEAFSDVGGDMELLENTLEKDKTETVDESYLSLYKKLRPSDAASIDNARSLIEPMFTDEEEYDLGKVGVYKFNQRMNLDKEKGTLNKEDITKVIKELIRLNNDPEAEEDDIDHLANRRIRSVGELLQSRLRIGFARLRRSVQDSMSTLDRDDLQLSRLINYKVLTSVVSSFVTSSQLSQFMDQTNPLSELEHKRRLSAMGPGGLTRERAGFDVRDVHRSHYGRICPIQTPEGSNIGLVNSLANYARLNEYGFVETPYFKVEDGKVIDEVVWLDGFEEEEHNIIQTDINLSEDGEILEDELPARVKGKPGECSKDEVDLMDVSPNQMISVATSLIPFLEHDDANRALMGSNMQRQAVPAIRPQAPFVGTGNEEKVVRDSGHTIFAEEEGKVVKVDGEEIVIETDSGKKEYSLTKFARSNEGTCISQRPAVDVGETVEEGDLLADGPSTDDGVLALGKNLKVAFMPWEGTNFEDAVIISEKVAEDDVFTSIHIDTYDCLVRDTKLGPELTTPDIPNVPEEKLKNLDEEGIVRIGAEVGPKDILVGKVSPKGESELSPEERLLRAIFGDTAKDIKDTSLKLPHGEHGRVIGVKIFSRDKGDNLKPGIIKKIQVEVAQIRKIKAGDKLAGRHGNKGVISQVRPVEDMPYMEDGTPVDIVLNPLSVISRMNLGQIYETHLGMAAKEQGYRAVVPEFVGATEEEIEDELEKAGLPRSGEVTLYDGLTGEEFDSPITVGYIYMMKLHHLIEDKIHMRSTGPYSLITQQPLGGKSQLGGQRLGEMEVWALEGYGAAHSLQEMLTIKSDDVMGRSAAFESMVRGESIEKPNVPASFNVMLSELKSIGMSVDYGSEDDPKEEAEKEEEGEKNNQNNSEE
ncbi:MAG: DNA-directed RNA polymerase subunit beta [Candidatus Magasanikbacteria bacterium]